MGLFLKGKQTLGETCLQWMKKNLMNELKIWAKSDDPFKGYEFFNTQYHHDPCRWWMRALGNVGRMCVTCFRTTPHSLCTHNFIFPSFFEFRIIFQHGSFKNICRIDKSMLYSSKKPTFWWHFWKKEGNVKFCVQREWGGVRKHVTDSANIAERMDLHGGRDRDVIKNSTIHNFWTDSPILLKFSQFIHVIFLHSLHAALSQGLPSL